MELIIFAVTEDHQLSLRLGTMSEPRTTLQSLVFSLNQCPQHGMLLMKIRPLLSHQTSNTFKLLELVSSILIIECQQDSSRKNLDNLMESTSQVILSKHSWILSLLWLWVISSSGHKTITTRKASTTQWLEFLGEWWQWWRVKWRKQINLKVSQRKWSVKVFNKTLILHHSKLSLMMSGMVMHLKTSLTRQISIMSLT